MAIVHWNGIPIFADIDPETYNLDPDSVRRAITPKPKRYSPPTYLDYL